MDACFGLARKKCKGEGLGQPRHGTLFFADQDDVDNFVENYNSTSNNLNDKVFCNVLYNFRCTVLSITCTRLHYTVPTVDFTVL